MKRDRLESGRFEREREGGRFESGRKRRRVDAREKRSLEEGREKTEEVQQEQMEDQNENCVRQLTLQPQLYVIDTHRLRTPKSKYGRSVRKRQLDTVSRATTADNSTTTMRVLSHGRTSTLPFGTPSA